VDMRARAGRLQWSQSFRIGDAWRVQFQAPWFKLAFFMRFEKGVAKIVKFIISIFVQRDAIRQHYFVRRFAN